MSNTEIKLPKVWVETAIKLASDLDDYQYEFGTLSSNARADIRTFTGYIKALKVLLK